MLPDKALGIVRAHIIMEAFKSLAGFALRTKAEREWFDGGFDVIVENNARFGPNEIILSIENGQS